MKTAFHTIFRFRFLLAALAIASIVTGCISRSNGNYSFGNRWSGRLDLRRDAKAAEPPPQVLPPAPAPAPAPAPFVPPAPPPPPVMTGNSTEIRTSNVLVRKTIQSRGSIGSDLETTLTLTPLRHIGEVYLNLYVPENATFVRSEPPPTTVAGRKITWEWFELKQNEVQNIKVWLRPTGQGNVRSCITVHALPMGCVLAEIGEPKLAITKTGPASASLGQPVTYNINVSNTGNSAAENIVVTDYVPAGMSHASGQQQVTMPAMNLQPGETKATTVILTPQQRGEFVNRAEAVSSNAGTVSDTAVTRVVQAGVSIDKTGPPQQFLGKSANYQITVQNTGDTTLQGVTVTDNAPSGARITDSSGAQVAGNQATWNIGTLQAGQSRTVSLGLAANQAGVTVNRATVRTAGGLSDDAQAETLWRGFAAVLVELVDAPDPILVGDENTYTIRVTNQGTAPDSQVTVRVNFPENVQPTSAGGATQGQIQGSDVVFGVLPTIAAKQVATWTIKARGTAKGDGRITCSVDTAILGGRPVTEIESTQVY